MPRNVPGPDKPDSAISNEAQRVAARRALAGVEPTAPRCGLALSGGGLRSATFSLGLIRALAKHRLLTRVDYLSTVSGGGYVGGMLGRLYNENNAKRVEERLAAEDSILLWWLRNHGRYLIPVGSRELQIAGASMLRAFVLNALLVIWLALLVALPALMVTQKGGGATLFHDVIYICLSAAGVASLHYWMSVSLRGYFLAGAALLMAGGYGLYHPGFPATITSSPGTGLLAAMMLYSLLLMAYAARCRGSPSRWRLGLTLHLRFWLMCALLLALLWALGAIARKAHGYLPTLWQSTVWLLALLASGKLLLLAGLLAKLPVKKGLLIRLSVNRRSWLNLAGVFILATLLALVANWLLALGESGLLTPVLRALPLVLGSLANEAWMLLVWCCALLTLCCLRAMPELLNLASLHHFYRARLERAWLSPGNRQRFESDPLDSYAEEKALKVKKVTRALEGDDIALQDYQPHRHGGPIHLINCCLNQTTDDRTGGYVADRKGRVLTVSSLGLERGGAAPEGNAPPGALSHWLTVSGAAVSAGTGSRTAPGAAFLIFLFGARLGYWQRNASAHRKSRENALCRVFRTLTAPPGYLAGEMLARFPGPDKRYVFLSDGGHVENTGVYALLKRRLPLIVLAECGADPDFLWDDLENLVRKARIELHTEITFDGDPPAPFVTPAHFSREPGSPLLLARLRYPQGETGALIVVKPRRLKNATPDTVAWSERDRGFPFQSTTYPLFDEEQWEAYHQCGLAAGELVDEALLEAALKYVRGR